MQVRPIPAIAMMSLALVSITAYQKLEAHLEGNHHDESQSQTYGEETTHETAHHEEAHKILVTSPLAKPVTITQQFVCQIHSHRHIEVCALESGYLEEIPVREGHAVKQGETMFRILPTLYDARLAAEKAEVQLAQIEFNNTEKLFQQKVVSAGSRTCSGQTCKGSGKNAADSGGTRLCNDQSSIRRHHRPPAPAAGKSD